MKQKELLALIVFEIILFITPPLAKTVASAPQILVVPIIGILAGFFFATNAEERWGKNTIGIIKWFAIFFAILFGVSVILVQGTKVLYEPIGLAFALWSIVDFMFGMIGAPFGIGFFLRKNLEKKGLNRQQKPLPKP